MKKVLNTIGSFIKINIILVYLHFFPIFGLAMNDTGTTYNTVLEALPMIAVLYCPLIIVLIVMIRKKQQDNIDKWLLIAMQTVLLLIEVCFGICNLVWLK